MALTKIKCIPIVIHLSNVPRSSFLCSGYVTARDQSMVESGVTEGRKTLPVFTFGDEHTQQESITQTLRLKRSQQAKKQRFSKLVIPEEKQQLLEEKDADNIRKALCKSFIERF